MIPLSLRPLAGADAGLYLALYCSVATMKYVAPAMPHTHALASFRAALALPAHPDFGVRRWVGQVGTSALALLACDPIAGAPASVEIGVLVLPEARRRGYAKAGLQLLIHQTRTAGANHWRMQINPDNEPMLQLAAGLGFHPGDGRSAGPHWQYWEAQWSQLSVLSRGSMAP